MASLDVNGQVFSAPSMAILMMMVEGQMHEALETLQPGQQVIVERPVKDQPDDLDIVIVLKDNRGKKWDES